MTRQEIIKEIFEIMPNDDVNYVNSLSDEKLMERLNLFRSLKKWGDKIKNKNNEFECCFCGKKFNGFGNNPMPVKNDGRCCDCCNLRIVIPERFKIINARK